MKNEQSNVSNDNNQNNNDRFCYSLLLTRNLQNRRNSLIIILQNMPHIIRHMLINQNNSNIVTLRKCLESAFDDGGGGVLFDDEKVCGVGGAVTYAC